MNPTMLEASDDLTNLSHLNEPAGKLDSSHYVSFHIDTDKTRGHQFCRPFVFDTSRRRSTHIRVSC